MAGPPLPTCAVHQSRQLSEVLRTRQSNGRHSRFWPTSDRGGNVKTGRFIGYQQTFRSHPGDTGKLNDSLKGRTLLRCVEQQQRALLGFLKTLAADFGKPRGKRGPVLALSERCFCATLRVRFSIGNVRLQMRVANREGSPCSVRSPSRLSQLLH
jgi:hypothetical protein